VLKLYRGAVPLLGNLKMWIPEIEVGAGPGEL
jgi:hypothetical protein